MPQSGIYQITNTITGSFYIGSSVNLKKRRNGHFQDLRSNRHHSPRMQRSFNIHGESAFVWSLLEEVQTDRDLLFERETYWVQTLQPQYNASKVSASNLGITRSEETKRKISKILTGRKQSEETRKKRAESLKGHIVSESARQKSSKSNRGQKRSEETIQKLREAGFSQTVSEETRQKLRMVHLGKKKNPESIAKRTATRRANTIARAKNITQLPLF